jgi:hypothetical protein
MVIDVGVNAISKVQYRSAFGKVNDVSYWCKNEHTIFEEIHLQRAEEFIRINNSFLGIF